MNERLNSLRQLMSRLNVAAVIIPGTDPHQSEDPCDHWQLREWITGFTGSAGTAVITENDARMWTDSRYFLQAEQQLADSGFSLMREGIDPDIKPWLAENLEEDDVLAIDGRLFSARETNRLEQFCGENGFMLATDFPVAERIWSDRPERPLTPTFVHNEELAGETVDSKLSRTRQAMEEMGADSLFIASLDDIAWLFNIRGNDVDFMPVTIAFAYVDLRQAVLFIDKEKITDEVAAHLKHYDVAWKPYDDVEHFLTRRSEHNVTIIDPDRVSDALASAMPCQKIYAPSPTTALKAVKNPIQIAGFRSAMERDGAALVRLFKWIEEKMAAGEQVTEISIAKRAIEERSKSELYHSESFGMIAGYREHGAIVHYQATPETDATLQPIGLQLIDTGAQYLDGTTDITRTITLGNPTPDEIHNYTLVLKGHLALERAQFPVGTCGVQLDAIARMPLWQEGKAFFHGTGHGVGHFLGCHEGPQSIRTNLNPTALEPGMITSDEPGLYLAGQYGIRIENLILCVEGEKTEEFGDFLRFETLTLFPYDQRLIDRSMLTAEEIEQINAYHATVRERLTPLLAADEAEWLAQKTLAIQ
ncbi:MAG: aminopeptidase P family protein [Muribaculaceae bacterium]|nr:aminopeptidase P family protein [Muribaculaceae bacterium]